MFIGHEYEDVASVFDVGSNELIKIASNLSNGRDIVGFSIKTPPKFYIGGMVNPFASELADEIISMKDKFESGARFFVTQPFFDIERLEEFRSAVGSIQAKVIISTVVLDSAARAKSMNNMPGIEMPKNIIEEIEASTNPADKGLEIATRIIDGSRAIYDGVHIINPSLNDVIPSVLNRSGIKRSSL